MTHLHFDHAGGLTTLDEDARRATFPKATHWVQRELALGARALPATRVRTAERTSTSSERATALATRSMARRRSSARRLLPMQTARLACSSSFTHRRPDAGLPRGPHPHGHVGALRDGLRHPTTANGPREGELLDQAVRHDWILVFEHDPDDAFARVERDARGRYRVAASAPTLAGLVGVPWTEPRRGPPGVGRRIARGCPVLCDNLKATSSGPPRTSNRPRTQAPPSLPGPGRRRHPRSATTRGRPTPRRTEAGAPARCGRDEERRPPARWPPHSETLGTWRSRSSGGPLCGAPQGTSPRSHRAAPTPRAATRTRTRPPDSQPLHSTPSASRRSPTRRRRASPRS